ncbi:hypothetical protein SAMN05421757_102694 [Tropicimonas sediminicola]|uniref:Uncharacterized protein n=1 Tax=Tropicimonas sediminicola TaxID=1031541 RepID=A0A239FKI8_9RHOB|nr:hypothetical protein SAMN05421757_102694 [Tropicimonas sediminicola]
MIVDGNYRARRLDDFQFVVERRKGRQPGNKRFGGAWRVLGYVTTPEGVMRLTSTKTRVCDVTGRQWHPAPAPSKALLDWLLQEMAASTARRKVHRENGDD